MLKGDVRGAVKYLTELQKGGVLLPDDIDEKTRLSVLEVLRSKHPYTTPPVLSSIHLYDVTPDLCDLDVTHDMIEQVDRNLPGSSGLGGVDLQAVSRWLLAFGNASVTLHHSLANFTSLMANALPPWVAYRALRLGHLLAFDKMSGVRPIGIGQTWQCDIAKSVLLVTVNEVTMTCKTDNLCGGLEGGVDGAIHSAQAMWDMHHMEEDWGFPLIEARNVFNELEWMMMLWNIRHG
jgi:hypothetical protein